MPPPCLRGLAQSAGDYALGSVKIVQVTTDTSCPWSSVGESGVRAALNAEGIGVLAVHDDRRIFGVNGHNYSHLVKILDGAGPSLHSAFARSDDLYYQWARSAEYLQHIALALACQEPQELVRVTDRPQIPRMISDAAWLAAAAHGSSIAALQSSLTTGLSNKADQSAFDVLEGVVATKSTPDGVGLKLSNYSTTAAMNGSIASANNATLATVAAQDGGGPALPRHSGEDHAAGGGHQGGQRSEYSPHGAQGRP